MGDLMALEELKEALKTHNVLELLNRELKAGVLEFSKEIYPKNFNYGFQLEETRFDRRRLPALIFALENRLVDSFFIKAYPKDQSSDQPLLLFWIERLLEGGMTFYDIERHRNACRDYRFLLQEPLWKQFKINRPLLEDNWQIGWKKIYDSITHPTLEEARTAQPYARIIFTSSQANIKLPNPMLVERDGNPDISKGFDSYSDNLKRRLVFRNIMERHGEIIGPEDWLLCAAFPPFRKGKTSRLSDQTWELVAGMTPSHAVGGNCNIEGLYMGPHGTNEALSYGRVRSVV